MAQALRDWLPEVIQAVEPWMSAEDVDKGARWSSDVATQLSTARVGIVCLTPENLQSPWVVFEAGALSSTLDKTFVCPYILDLGPADLTGPFVQFQATKANKMDTKKLLLTINKASSDEALSSDRLNSAFERWWPDFEERLKQISSLKVEKGLRDQAYKTRSDREVLYEILELARNIERAYGKKPVVMDSLDEEVFSTIKRYWQKIVDATKSKKIHLGSFLNEGFPFTVSNGVLEVRFGADNAFHLNTIQQNKRLIEDIVKQVTGYHLDLICTAEKAEPRQKKSDEFIV